MALAPSQAFSPPLGVAPAAFDLVRPELLVPPDIPIKGSWRTDAGVVLDRELMGLAAADSRCRLVQARIVARIVETKAWRRLGFVRLSDYCRERVGLAPRSLEEDARLLRALSVLPRMEEALEKGELTWTRTRILARVATAENEASLLRQSQAVPLRELEEFVRGFAKAQAGGEGEAGEGDAAADGADDDTSDPDAADPILNWSIQVSRGGRRMWRFASEYASRSAGSPLSPGQVLELVAAEANSSAPHASADASDASPHSSDASADASQNGSPDQTSARHRYRRGPDYHERWFRHCLRTRQRRGQRLLFAFLAETGVAEGFPWLAPRSLDPGPARRLERLLIDLKGADAFELEDRLRRLRQLAQRLDAQMAALLRTGIDRRLFAEIGFASVKLYVESRLGISSRRAWTLVAIERHGWRSSRLLCQAWHQGRITTLQAKAILPIIDELNAAAWIERAEHTTLRRLIDEVGFALDANGTGAARPSRAMPPDPATKVWAEGTAEIDQGEVQKRAHGEASRLGLGPAGPVRLQFVVPLSVAVLVETTMDELHRDREERWQTFERMTALALLEWMAAPRHRDPIFERDGWRCAVPACSSRRNLHDHHVLFRSHGGDNARDNRITVCAAHHLHGIHSGIVRARGRAPGDLWWELGCAAGRSPAMRLHGDYYVE